MRCLRIILLLVGAFLLLESSAFTEEPKSRDTVKSRALFGTDRSHRALVAFLHEHLGVFD